MITQIAFVDDTILFGAVNSEEAENLKAVLATYEMVRVKSYVPEIWFHLQPKRATRGENLNQATL